MLDNFALMHTPCFTSEINFLLQKKNINGESHNCIMKSNAGIKMILNQVSCVVLTHMDANRLNEITKQLLLME